MFLSIYFFLKHNPAQIFSILTVKRPKWFAVINCEFLFRPLRVKSCGGGHPKTCLPVSAELAARLRGGFWLVGCSRVQGEVISSISQPYGRCC